MAFDELIGLVTLASVIAGATVSLVAVLLLWALLPAPLVAVAVYVIVPSASAVTSMPLIDQVPSPAIVAV